MDEKEKEKTMTLCNVLLVDDETAFVETMAKRLAKRNLQVSAAYNGNEALQEVRTRMGITQRTSKDLPEL